jgi:hypothetical protein
MKLLNRNETVNELWCSVGRQFYFLPIYHVVLNEVAF